MTITKPRLSFLVVLTTACGLAIAPGDQSLVEAFMVLLGTWCIVAAANAVNCLLEKDVDGLMTRTKERPLVTGELGDLSALLWAAFLSFSSMFLLLKYSNPLTAILGLIGFVLYVALYTPLKRLSMTALFAGAIPGAIPPMMGWASVSGQLSLEAWLLFGILFFWQLPHFIAISLFRLQEYNRAGLKTVPGTLGTSSAQNHMLVYTALLMVVTLLPFSFGKAGAWYLAASSVLGFGFLFLCLFSLASRRSLNWNRIIFIGSLAYLPLILGMWVMDRMLE